MENQEKNNYYLNKNNEKMVTSENNNNYYKIQDVKLKKYFELKLKPGAEMKFIHLDESQEFRNLFFLKSYKLYKINFRDKKIRECEVAKSKELVYIAGNSNNDSLICIFKNGKIIAIDPYMKIKAYNNINMINFISNPKKELNFDKFNFYINNFLDKIIFETETSIVIWYKNKFNQRLDNSEITGTFFNLNKQLEMLKANIDLKNTTQINKPNFNYICTAMTANFSNNFYLGSHAKIFFIITETKLTSNKTKLTIIDYLFQFDYNSKFRSTPYSTSQYIDTYQNFYNTEEIEDLNDIKTKISSCYLNLFEGEIINTLQKQKILVKSNIYGNCLAICINFNIIRNTLIIFFMTETYQFTSKKLNEILGLGIGMNIEISQIDWIGNDMFLIILFNTGAFCLININFQIIYLIDVSKSVMPYDNYYIPMYYNSTKLKTADQIKLLTSKQRDDIFFIFSNLYIICYLIDYKSYENRLLTMEIPLDNFEDFLFELKYFQLYLSSSDIEIPDEDINIKVFDIIHKHVTEMLKVGGSSQPGGVSQILESNAPTYTNNNISSMANNNINNNNKNKNKNNKNIENTNQQNKILTSKSYYSINREKKQNKGGEMTTTQNNINDMNKISNDLKSETVNHLMKTFVKFIRIFRSINLLHETNLTTTSYFIGKSYDFFIHLINHKEIWLAVLFVELCEKYLCENLRLVPGSTKLQKYSKNSLKNLPVNNKNLFGNEANLNEENRNYNFSHNEENGGINISKANLYKLLFKPNILENLAFDSYRYINPKILYSHMRLLLLFFFLFEFRNNFALNIQVLYFTLAKITIKKLKQYDLLDELLNVARIIVKNYKYLKQENDKIGKDEYVLNTISMSYKNEIFSNIHISQTERDDLNFDYFSEFYSIDEFLNFVEPNRNYVKNETAEMAKDFNYLNHLGQLQKWIILFNNYLYWELFSDIKKFLDNHFRQMLNKNEENTSPEEKTLSRLVYFNINFFMQIIQFVLKHYFTFITQKTINSPEAAFDYFSLNILNDYNKVLMPTISPVEIPFLIFEFYIEQTDPNQKSLHYEINIALENKIKEKSKTCNTNIDDILYFVEFLLSYNFKFDINNVYNTNKFYNYNSIDNNSYNSNLLIDYDEIVKKKIQNYTYSAFLFYFFIIHKLNLIYLLDTERDLLLGIIETFDYNQKKEIYEYLFLMVNGQLKYYLKNDSKLNQNEGKFIEIILNFMKLIFYKMLREEPVLVRDKIFDYIRITPNLMKSYLLEGAFYYEYKTFKMLIKKHLFSFKEFVNIPSEANYQVLLNMIKNYLNLSKINIFDIFFNKKNDDSIFKILDKLFYFEQSSMFNNEFYTTFSLSLNNLISLCIMPYYDPNNRSNNTNNNYNESENKKLDLIFSLETNKEYIRQLIYDSLTIDSNNNKEKNTGYDENDPKFLEKLTFNFTSNAIDKIIKGNFENKTVFKFSNVDLKIKLVYSIKSIIIKFLHLLITLYLKLELLTINPYKDKYNYISKLSYCLLFELNNNFGFESFGHILAFLKTIDLSKAKSENDIDNLVSIIKNIYIVSLVYQMTDKMKKQLSEIEMKMEIENKNIKNKYINFLMEEFPKIKQVYEKIKYLKSKNFRIFSFCLFSDYYINSMYKVYNQLSSYLSKNNIIFNEPFKEVKTNYIQLTESFYNITGIPPKYFMEFKKTWNLGLNEELYNTIILEEKESINYYVKNERSSLLMNKRQKCGVETPRRQRFSLNNRRRKSSSRNNSKDKHIRSDSLNIREEDIPKNNNKNKGIKSKNKIPKCAPGGNKINNNVNINNAHLNNKDFDDYEEINNNNNFKYNFQNEIKYLYFQINSLILKHTFLKIKKYSYNVKCNNNKINNNQNNNNDNNNNYSISTNNFDLINSKLVEHTVVDNSNLIDSSNIIENSNLIDDGDDIKNNNNNQIKLITIHNTNIQLNSEDIKEDGIKKEKNYEVEPEDKKKIENNEGSKNIIKPLDFINISKKNNKPQMGKINFFTGAIKAASFGKNIEVNSSNEFTNSPAKNAERKSKNKLDELSEKLNKYENMAQNLGKLYVNSVFNQNPNSFKKKKK